MKTIIRYCLVTLFCIACFITGASADTTTLDSIFSKNQFIVVSTEHDTELKPLLNELNIKTTAFYQLDAATSRTAQIRSANVIFIINREKAGQDISVLNRLAGQPLESLDSNLVTLTAFINQERGEGWHILLLAPNTESLLHELKTLPVSPDMDKRINYGEVQTLHSYKILNFDVITTEDQKTIENWFSPQSQAGGDILTWSTINTSQFSTDTPPTNDRIILISRNQIDTASFRDLLPDTAGNWLESENSKTEIGAMRGRVSSSLSSPEVHIICAPSHRNLLAALGMYPTLKSIPSQLTTTKLNYFGGMKKVAVTVCRKDTKDEFLGLMLPEFGNTLVSMLSDMKTGIQFTSAQTSETINSIESSFPDFKISDVHDRPDALLVIRLDKISGAQTRAYPQFSLPKPGKPVPPAKPSGKKVYNQQMKIYSKKLAAWNAQKKSYDRNKSDAIHFWANQITEGGNIEITASVKLETARGIKGVDIGNISSIVNYQNTAKPSVMQGFTFLCTDIVNRIDETSVFSSLQTK